MYKVKYLPDEAARWDNAGLVRIGCDPWGRSVYTPEAAVRVCYGNDAFYVRFDITEDHILAVNTQPNGPVHEDSCVEWFINPCPDISDKYVNFEINAIGTMHAALGAGRHERKLLDAAMHGMVDIKPYIDSPYWRMEYTVPFEFFHRLYGAIDFTNGYKMKGNFYKCSNNNRKPHWLCWNKIGSPQPDFHRPEWFGDIILQ